MADWEGPSGHEVNEAAESVPDAQPAEGAPHAENPTSASAAEGGAEAVAPAPVPTPDEPPFLIWLPPEDDAGVLPEDLLALQASLDLPTGEMPVVPAEEPPPAPGAVEPVVSSEAVPEHEAQGELPGVADAAPAVEETVPGAEDAPDQSAMTELLPAVEAAEAVESTQLLPAAEGAEGGEAEASAEPAGPTEAVEGAEPAEPAEGEQPAEGEAAAAEGAEGAATSEGESLDEIAPGTTAEEVTEGAAEEGEAIEAELAVGPKTKVWWWPFVGYIVVWLAAAAYVVYELRLTPIGQGVYETDLYRWSMLGGLILLALGPLLLLIVWLASWIGRENRRIGLMFISAFVKGATATFIGAIIWIGAIVLIDYLRFGRPF